MNQLHVIIAQLLQRRAVDLSFSDPLYSAVFRRVLTVVHLPLVLVPGRRARQSLDSFLVVDARGVGGELACARLAERAELAAKVLAEEVQQRTDDGRHAGADDADLALDATP